MEANNAANHEKKLLSAFEKLKQVKDLLPELKWKETKVDKDSGFINHAREDAEAKISATRGEGVLPFPMEKLVALLGDPTTRKLYVKKIKEISILANTPGGYPIVYQNMEAPMGSDRDILSIQGKFEDNGWTYMVSTSVVDDALKPEVKSNVRADNHYQGYIMKPEGSDTKMIYVACLDIKGMVPGFVKNKMVNSKGIQGILNIQDYLLTAQ